MVVLLVIVVLYHSTINKSYWPLVNSLPISLAPKIAAFEKHGSNTASSNNVGLGEKTISNTTTNGGGPSSPVVKEKELKEKEAPTDLTPDSPTAAMSKDKQIQLDAGDDYGNDDEDEIETHDRINAFNHPSSYKSIQTAWFADDTLGIGRNETAA